MLRDDRQGDVEGFRPGLRPGPFLVGIALTMAFLVFIKEEAAIMQYRGREATCLTNLAQIGRVVTAYRHAHAGRLPPDFHTLQAALDDRWRLVCPMSGMITEPVFEQRSYTCRLDGTAGNADAVC